MIVTIALLVALTAFCLIALWFLIMLLGEARKLIKTAALDIVEIRAAALEVEIKDRNQC